MRAWLRRLRIKWHLRRAGHHLWLAGKHQGAVVRLRRRIAP